MFLFVPTGLLVHGSGPGLALSSQANTDQSLFSWLAQQGLSADAEINGNKE